MRKYLLPSLLAIFFSSSLLANSLVVIANPNSGVKKLSREELINLYLGRTKKLPSGITVLPIDWSADSEEKRIFYQALVNKSLTEIQAYWARLLFTGQSVPPLQANNAAEILEKVSHNQGAIGYIDRKDINHSVTVVYEFNNADLP